MSQRFEGRNLEEALIAAVHGLGVERYQLRHRVLVEKRGFLGGMKRVVIEVEVNEDASVPAPIPVPSAPPLPVPASDAAPVRAGDPGRGRNEGRGRRGGRGDARAQGRGSRDGRGAARGGPRRESDLQPGDFGQFAQVIPEQGPESEATALVRDWCEEVLDLARVRVELRTEEKDDRIDVRIYGSDSRRLLDRNGELIDALQVLANKALVGRKIEKLIEVDCDGFKERRGSDLERQAKEVAERVRRDGGEELLPAMSPAERRLVHLALQDDPDVTTESRGEGFFKRVAVIPRAAVPAPEP